MGKPGGLSKIRNPSGFGNPKGSAPAQAPGCHRSASTYSTYLRKASEVLCPPKPKAFEMATSTGRACGSLKV